MKKLILTAACLSLMTSNAFAATSIPAEAVEFEGHHSKNSADTWQPLLQRKNKIFFKA